MGRGSRAFILVVCAAMLVPAAVAGDAHGAPRSSPRRIAGQSGEPDPGEAIFKGGPGERGTATKRRLVELAKVARKRV